MSQFFTILMIAAMVLTLVSLAVGIGAMIKGGEFNAKYGNRLMRLRVTLQGVALVLFAFALLSAN